MTNTTKPKELTTQEKKKLGKKLKAAASNLLKNPDELKKLASKFSSSDHEAFRNMARHLNIHTKVQEKYNSLLSTLSSDDFTIDDFHKECLASNLSHEMIILMEAMIGTASLTTIEQIQKALREARKRCADWQHRHSRRTSKVAKKYCSRNTQKSQAQCARDFHNIIENKNTQRAEQKRPRIHEYSARTIEKWLTGVRPNNKNHTAC